MVGSAALLLFLLKGRACGTQKVQRQSQQDSIVPELATSWGQAYGKKGCLASATLQMQPGGLLQLSGNPLEVSVPSPTVMVKISSGRLQQVNNSPT